MIKFILRRIAVSIPVIFLVATTTFFIMRLAPGGPFMSERAIPPEILANLTRFTQPALLTAVMARL